MSTPPRWTKEPLNPDRPWLHVWHRREDGYDLFVKWNDFLCSCRWWIDGTEESGGKLTAHAAKWSATMALKRITKRSE